VSQRLAVPASGSPALDRASIEAFEASDEMIQVGLCPNGCGTMEVAADGHSCSACGFAYHRVQWNPFA
jgi:hypothetical protein